MKLKKTILRIRNETNCSFLKDSKILKLFSLNACIIQKDFVSLRKEIKYTTYYVQQRSIKRVDTVYG